MEKQICPWIIESDSFCLDRDDPVNALKRKQARDANGSHPVLRVQSARPMKKDSIYGSQRLTTKIKEQRGKSQSPQLESAIKSLLLKSSSSTKPPYDHFQLIQFDNIQSKGYCSLRLRNTQIHSKKELCARNPLEKASPGQEKTVQLNERIRALLTNSRANRRNFPCIKEEQLTSSPSLLFHRRQNRRNKVGAMLI